MGLITDCLVSIREGNEKEEHELYNLAYTLLKGLAKERLEKKVFSFDLRPTELIHEAWLRLANHRIEWSDSRAFLISASEAMRRVLIDLARSRMRQKRSGPLNRVELTESSRPFDPFGVEMLALNEALETLEEIDADKAHVVKLKFFWNMTNKEIAETLDLSTSSVERYWSYSKAWLGVAMEGDRALERLL